MDVSWLVEQLEVEGGRLGDAAAAGDFGAAIPGCADWTVRDVVAHIGVVHRWARAIVGQALTGPKVEPPAVPADGELIEWYRAGHATLVETLRAAPADLDCWSFLPAPSPLAFWARRQALETAVHRSDVEGAGGSVSAYDDELALIGIDELLGGFGTRKTAFEPATIKLAPAGAQPWLVSLSGEGLRAVRADGGADVTVGGSASEVYRWTWNRPGAQVDGDGDLAAEWQKLAVRWS